MDMDKLKGMLTQMSGMLSDACKMCEGGLYPKDEDSESDMNGAPKTWEGTPMESDSEGNGFGAKDMKKKAIAKMLSKKMGG